MNRDSRLSSVLHALLHMAAQGVPMTSEALAVCMQAHPVVVRRTMAGLREAGFVRSEKGRGGGWSINCDLAAVSLRDVHVALGEPTVFAMANRNPKSSCLVEQAVNAALEDAFHEAEALLLDRFGSVSLARLIVVAKLESEIQQPGHSVLEHDLQLGQPRCVGHGPIIR